MIPAVAQTLAEILAGNASSIGTEQIDFDRPTVDRGIGPRLNLYCYELRPTEQRQYFSQNSAKTSQQPEAIVWFDISFMITAWDSTAIGEQHLLSEALTQILSHQRLPEELLPKPLRGYGALPMGIFTPGLSHAIALWDALGVPLRPALYITVTIPVSVMPTEATLTPNMSLLKSNQ